MTTGTIDDMTDAKSKNKVENKKNYYTRAGMRKVANMQLPDEVINNFIALTEKNLKTLRNDYIVALVNAGWTNVSIAKSAGLSNEMVRIIVGKHDAEEVPPTLAVPEVPKHEPKSKSSTQVLPPPELLARLLKLQPAAQKVRSNSQRYRAEAEEYSYLINQAHTMYGVSLYRLAKLLNVTTSALVFRLVRYGYKTSEGKSMVYTKVKNRPTKA
jgi:hypothetical protein